MATTSYVIDASERDFAATVIERSRTVPVVVDFWAAWCGPCRVLGPVLERLAGEASGAWVLAKVDVDQNQRLAGQFGVQGIPAVKAFRDGAVVDQFEGALPESRVRAWLGKLVPSPVEQLADEAVQLETVDPAAARRLYERALAADAGHSRSQLGLGRVLALQADGQAADVLRRVALGTPEYATAQALLDLLPLLAAADDTNLNGDQLAAQWAAAAHAARAHDWQAALDHLLALVGRERTWHDGAARRAMLAIFALLGDSNTLVPRYRQRLAGVLFG
jgi:putative thioredoxin